jgi:hypothetical protein
VEIPDGEDKKWWMVFGITLPNLEGKKRKEKKRKEKKRKEKKRKEKKRKEKKRKEKKRKEKKRKKKVPVTLTKLRYL